MPQPLVMACISDLAGQVRGKGFALADLDKRRNSGIGWTPTNAQITCFDGIAPSPYGSTGDLILWPDPDRLIEAAIPGSPPLRMVLGDVTDRDGKPWECCLRNHLRASLDALHEITGLELRASFEHEFMLRGLETGSAFSLEGFHAAQAFSETLLAALDQAGLPPDSFLREYGPAQFEVTLPPKPALRAADDAIALRQITRAIAKSHGLTATFAPILDAESVGNGVHVHLSLWDKDGNPCTHDPDAPAGLTETAGQAAAGIVAHMPGMMALTAPSHVSAIRLQPHRWSAGFANLAVQDREAGLRICPVTAKDPEIRARQFNYEYRAADAAASPWLSLSALTFAAVQGIRDSLPTPEPTEGDLSLLDKQELEKTGITPLPRDADAALAALEADEILRGWYPPGFVPIYLDHKRHEYAAAGDLDEADAMAAYARVY